MLEITKNGRRMTWLLAPLFTGALGMQACDDEPTRDPANAMRSGQCTQHIKIEDYSDVGAGEKGMQADVVELCDGFFDLTVTYRDETGVPYTMRHIVRELGIHRYPDAIAIDSNFSIPDLKGRSTPIPPQAQYVKIGICLDSDDDDFDFLMGALEPDIASVMRWQDQQWQPMQSGDTFSLNDVLVLSMTNVDDRDPITHVLSGYDVPMSPFELSTGDNMCTVPLGVETTPAAIADVLGPDTVYVGQWDALQEVTYWWPDCPPGLHGGSDFPSVCTLPPDTILTECSPVHVYIGSEVTSTPLWPPFEGSS